MSLHSMGISCWSSHVLRLIPNEVFEVIEMSLKGHIRLHDKLKVDNVKLRKISRELTLVRWMITISWDFVNDGRGRR